MSAPVAQDNGPAPEPARPAASAARPAGGISAVAAPRLAAILLGAACVAWTATPPLHSGIAVVTLTVAIAAVTMGALRLALSDVPQPEDNYFLPAAVRAWLQFLAVLRLLPWEEVAVAVLLWLEVQHPAKPWHTAALGAGLVAYLLAVHIAESGASAAGLLRRQARVLTAGACLLALGMGAAYLPAAGQGAGATLLRVLAAAAIIAAAALVLPS